MDDFRHHILMVNYYQKLSDNIQKKIFKTRYVPNHSIYDKELEIKLRLKKIEIDEEIEWHQQQFVKSYNGLDYIIEPSEKEVFEYAYLFKQKNISSKVTSEG